MRIRIEAIEAKLINSSTPTYDDYIIPHWMVKYTIEFAGGPPHSIEGKMEWLEAPDARKILEYLRNRYTDKPNGQERKNMGLYK